MKSIILIFIGLLGLNVQIYSQVKHFTRQQLNEDLDSLYSIIHEIHLDMFATISKAEFEDKLADIKMQTKDSMNRIEFYNLISPLVADIGDGHTSLYFPRQDLETINAKLFPFPVEINWKDSTVRISEDRSVPKTTIPTGAKIIKINDKLISQVVGEMYKHISGEKTFFKAASLKFDFTPLLYSMYNDTVFTIKYEFKGLVETAHVKGITYERRYQTNSTQQANPDNRSCVLTVIPDSSIAIITINNFLDDGHWATFMDSSFNMINDLKIKDLIIDVRQNGGGFSELGDFFFQYISQVDFRQFGKTIIKTSERQIEFQKIAYNMNQQNPIGIITTGEDSELIKLNDNPLRFFGNKYLLISNYTFSSAASFSWAFQYFKMGKVVGEESGGMAVCFGEVIQQTLPNTNLQFSISHNKYYHYGATDKDIHGTIPDYIVPADSALDYTLGLIMNER